MFQLKSVYIRVLVGQLCPEMIADLDEALELFESGEFFLLE